MKDARCMGHPHRPTIVSSRCVPWPYGSVSPSPIYPNRPGDARSMPDCRRSSRSGAWVTIGSRGLPTLVRCPMLGKIMWSGHAGGHLAYGDGGGRAKAPAEGSDCVQFADPGCLALRGEPCGCTAASGRPMTVRSLLGYPQVRKRRVLEASGCAYCMNGRTLHGVVDGFPALIYEGDAGLR